jgi:hypothetical protein
VTEDKETFAIKKGKAHKMLSTKGISKHLIEYNILSDTIGEDGTRTLVFKPTDASKFLQRVAELAAAMVEKLGEGENKLLRTMLADTLRDYREEDIDDMYRKVVLREQPVKYREGCFKLIIGDGRKKGRHEIMLVE